MLRQARGCWHATPFIKKGKLTPGASASLHPGFMGLVGLVLRKFLFIQMD